MAAPGLGLVAKETVEDEATCRVDGVAVLLSSSCESCGVAVLPHSYRRRAIHKMAGPATGPQFDDTSIYIYIHIRQAPPKYRSTVTCELHRDAV